MRFRSTGWRIAGIALLSTAALALPDQHRLAQGSRLDGPDKVSVNSPLSVMTYNIEGLPWPVRFGRAAAFDRISQRLRDLRDAGAQPHIILLQEAFADQARAIGAQAGYRYIIDGPDAETPGGKPLRIEDAGFAAGRSFWKGERSGKVIGSGLQILSDYRVLQTKREAFPANLCAGYDCMANKGIVMAVLDVPGQAGPIAVVDVHLNSGKAAGVPRERSLVAYRGQIDYLVGFLRRAVPADMPVLLGGDFNIGRYPGRRDYVEARLAPWLGKGPRNAFAQCLTLSDCRDHMSSDAHGSLRHAKDWQFLRPGRAMELRTELIATPFGHDAEGQMLSDHIGYTVTYRFGRRDGQADGQWAMAD